MAQEDSAPCPHCRAENFAHRRECWRCKRTLPTSFALDAQLRRQRLSSERAARPTTGDIRNALDQVELIDDTIEQGEPQGIRKLVWHLKNRTKPT